MTRSPARERAVSYLMWLSRRGRRSRQYRLPSYREMAEGAGVSTVTVWKALRSLERDGVLRSDAGHWIVAAESRVAHAQEPHPQQSGCLWERTAALVRRDVQHGVFTAGQGLPQCKQLSSRYGVCPATMRRVLGHLTSTHVLERHGRHYRVRRSTMVRHASTVILVAFGRGVFELTTPRTRDNYRALESACSRRGLRLQTVSVDRTERSVPSVHSALQQCEQAVGAMVWDSALDEALVEAIVGVLRQHDLPVALLCETVRSYRALRSARDVHQIETGNSVADGRRVGQFLIDRGHRRVAYVSPYADGDYSINRRDGLIGAFVDGGYGNAVVACETSREVSSGELSELARGVWRQIGDQYADVDYPAVREAIRKRGLAPHLKELFERALSDPAVTAWVCNNDTVALEALHYLALRRYEVPGHIALVGFDDTQEAFMEGLTSYSFDPTGLAQAMLNQVLLPMDQRRTAAPRPMSLGGFVNERLTT